MVPRQLAPFGVVEIVQRRQLVAVARGSRLCALRVRVLGLVGVVGTRQRSCPPPLEPRRPPGMKSWLNTTAATVNPMARGSVDCPICWATWSWLPVHSGRRGRRVVELSSQIKPKSKEQQTIAMKTMRPPSVPARSVSHHPCHLHAANTRLATPRSSGSCLSSSWAWYAGSGKPTPKHTPVVAIIQMFSTIPWTYVIRCGSTGCVASVGCG